MIHIPRRFTFWIFSPLTFICSSKMLTEREANVLNLCNRIFGKYVSIPFRWNSEDGQMFIKSKTNIYVKMLLWILVLLKLTTNINQLRVLGRMGDMDSLFVHAYLTSISGGHVMIKVIFVISFQKHTWIDLNHELWYCNATWGNVRTWSLWLPSTRSPNIIQHSDYFQLDSRGVIDSQYTADITFCI